MYLMCVMSAYMHSIPMHKLCSHVLKWNSKKSTEWYVFSSR